MGYKRVPLNTLRNTSKTLQRLIRDVLRDEEGELDMSRMRLVNAMMSNLISAHRLEKELELDERIERIEKKLGFK